MNKCKCCGKNIFGATPEYCTKCGAPMPGSDASRTINGGIEMLKRNRFTDAMSFWRAAVKAHGQPSYREYQEMLRAIKDCVVSHLSDTEYYSRSGISDLAVDIDDRDLMRDVMKIYVDSIPDARTKRQLHRLFAEYIYIVFESFNVYPDFNEMADILDRTHEVSERILGRFPTLPGESRNAEIEFGFFKDYSEYFANRIRDRIKEEGPERMKAIVSYWNKQTSLPYAQLAIETSMSFSKAKTARRPTDRKDLDAEKKLDKLFDAYFGMPFEEPKKKRK